MKMPTEPEVAALDEATLMALMRHLQDGVFVIENRRFIHVDALFSDIVGRTPADLIGMHIMDVVHPADQDAVASRYRRREEGDPVENLVQFRVVRPDGGIRTARVRMGVSVLENGRTLSIGSMQDITETVEAREALLHSRADIDRLLRHLPDIFYRTDTGGYIVNLSPACERIFGYTVDEMIGRKLSEFYLDPSERKHMAAAILDGAGEARHVEARMVRKDGGIIHIATNAYMLIDGEGNPAGIEGIARDVTAQREAQLAAEAANRAKSEFLANVSHELRTPLNPILGYSELILNSAGDELSDRHRRFVGDILSSGKHLLALIDDLLDIARIEAGQMSIRREFFDLHEEMDVISELIRPEYARSGNRLELSYRNLVDGTEVEADRRKFRQILLNLLTNARKYGTPDTPVEVTLSADEADLEIRVADQGKGIAPADLARIFERFERARGPGHPMVDGAGIGLPISRELAELHGGSLHLESEPGKGTTAILNLPGSLTSGSA